MKIRSGFVSNSSSSSYICIGVSSGMLISYLLEAEGFKVNPEDGYNEGEGYGHLSGKYVQFCGHTGNWHCAGFKDEDTLKLLDKHSLNECKEIFIDMVKKKLGLTIKKKDVNLHYGEAGSE